MRSLRHPTLKHHVQLEDDKSNKINHASPHIYTPTKDFTTMSYHTKISPSTHAIQRSIQCKFPTLLHSLHSL